MLCMAQGVSVASDATSDYRLGPQDKVKLSVYEWRASRDEVFEWKALNSEYIVNASGRLAVPLIGEIQATGITTADLAQEIGQKLRERLGFATAPDISLQVVQFRPFYVTGYVDRPGEYPYRPDLTVLQAAAIAGGQRKEPGLLRLEREAIAARGDMELYAMEMTGLMARSARLSAELKGSAKIDFPAALLERAGESNIGFLLSQEDLIHTTRTQAFDNQVAALEKLKDFLEQEVKSLTAQLAAHDRQVSSMHKELGEIKDLVAKGYATVSRQNNLDRAEAQLLGDRLRLESNLMKARQEASRTEVMILELRNKRSTEVTTELRASQQKLEELSRKVATAEKLLNESEVIAPLYATQRSRSKQPELSYSIVRVREGQSMEIPAAEGTRIEPGDTIKVDVVKSETGALSGKRQVDAPKVRLGAGDPVRQQPQPAKFSGN